MNPQNPQPTSIPVLNGAPEQKRSGSSLLHPFGMGTASYQAPPSAPPPPPDPNIINGYDMGSWNAQNPEHIKSISTIYNQLKNSPPVEMFQNDIDRVGKMQGAKSPISQEMIGNSASKYGVDPTLLATVMRQDTSYGIHALTPYNPSNIGNFGSSRVKFANWQEGVDETARYLSTLNTLNRQKFVGLKDPKQ